MRVKSKVELRLPGRVLDNPPGSVSVSKVLEASAGENASVLEMSEVTALRESGSRHLAETSSEVAMLEVSSVLRDARPRWLAEEGSEVSSGSRRLVENVVVSKVSEAFSAETDGDSVRISELLEEPQLVGGAAESAAHATAGDSEGIIGLHVSHSSRVLPINSSNSSGCFGVDACARAPALPAASASASSSASPSASLAVVAHDARRATDAGRLGVSSRIHDSVTVNSSGASSHACVSYLDALLAAPARALAASAAFRTSRTSAVVGLCMHDDDTPMHDAHNSWSDTGRVQGPTGRRCTKGGVSGPAEDLRPVAEVEAGVNFRLAGGVRGQVAGSLPRKQPGTGTRQVKGSVVTPSLHPEVFGIQFVSPGQGLDIRQSMGWTKVCGTARSGIWVLKGNASARMLPENLDYLRVGWISRGTYEIAWVTPGHDCLCSYQYGHGAAVRPQTNAWGYWFVVQGRTPLVTLVCQEGGANGSELEPVLRSKFMYPLASR